jgi:hypothetical protein
MRRLTSVMFIAALAVLTAAAGCSSSSHSSTPSSSAISGPAPTVPTPTTRAPASAGPAAGFSGPVTGGRGINLIATGPVDVAKVGYTSSEYFASGTARSYRAVGAQGKDGRWTVAPKGSATYRTRIVVHRPRDPRKFNGTLLVEWLNVTAGADVAADFSTAGVEITRAGFAWVGVSAQQIGVQGGAAVINVGGLANGGLRGSDPARYGSLHHPGDQYAADIFSQIGRALRAPHGVDALGGLRPQRMIAIGDSQSAFQLTTYVNAIQPTARIFDGFFLHSRGGGAIPVSGGGIESGLSGGIHIRDDLDVPVFMFETETDETFLHYFDARQPDSAHIRLWDVAGGAHADAYTLGGNPNVLPCGGAINNAPTHYVVEAAIHQLDLWVRTGTPPPSAPRMQVTLVKTAPQITRDALGNALGGVRTAANDVPIAALTGVATSKSVLCLLFGTTRAFDPATLKRLYPTEASYLDQFRTATEKAIASGYILPADRAEILAAAAKVAI